MFCPGMSPFMMGGGLVGLLIVLLFAVWAVKQFVPAGGVRFRETPLDLLQRRYAEGKLTKQEYDERRKDLE